MSRRWILLMVAGLFAGTLSVTAAEVAEHAGDAGINERMTMLVLQLAVIVCAAKAGGVLCRRYLRIPEVLGELGAGVIIGPYALGPLLGVFAEPAGQAFPVSAELYGIATLASIILLYLAGLETDLSMFLKYSVAGSLVGIGGVVFSFVLGTGAAVWTGFADSYLAPGALFLGTISTATSVGITARVLSERNQLDSAEGVTILSGAVIDDVLGIIVLAVVVSMSKVADASGHVDWQRIVLIGGRAVGFWLGCTAIGLLAARRVAKVLEFFGSHQTMATLSLGLALMLAGLSEMAGLAMIIGAYIVGLSFSSTDCAPVLRQRLEPVYETLVAVFFCVMGMMVNFKVLDANALGFALLYTILAVAAKMVGCGVPALFMKFNLLGALRVGTGMLPRGEVALIVAGVGLAAGLVSQSVFGVAVLMTLFTTVAAPLIMVRIFDERPGQVESVREGESSEAQPLTLDLPNQEVADFLLSRIAQTFEQEECYVQQPAPGADLYHIRKDDIAITVRQEGDRIILSCREADRLYARLVLMESVAQLIQMLEGLRHLENVDTFRDQVMS